MAQNAFNFRRVFFFTSVDIYDQLKPYFGSGFDSVMNEIIVEFLERQRTKNDKSEIGAQ